MRRRSIYVIVAAVVAAVLVVGNPSESNFLNTVAADYGSMHGGMELSTKELAHIGTSHYRSFLLFSVYEYEFGNISVSYFGIAFMMFYQGSSVSDTKKSAEDLQAFTRMDQRPSYANITCFFSSIKMTL